MNAVRNAKLIAASIQRPQKPRLLLALAATAITAVGCSTLPDEEPYGLTKASSSSTSSSGGSGGAPFNFGSSGNNASVGADVYSAQASKAWQDVLGRQPDDGTLQSQISQMNAGTLTIAQLRSSLATSLEAANNVKAKFLQLLNRTASDSEVGAWQGYLANGSVTFAGLTSAFTSSSAFQTTVLTAVRQNYQSILGRNPSQAEIDAMKNAIIGGDSYANRRRLVAFSDESQSRANALFIMAVGRGWNEGERDYWCTQLANGLRLSDVEIQLLQSGSFSGRYPGTSTYVAQSYIQVLGRAPDGGGLASFTDQINKGALSYSGARQTLAASDECGNLVNSIYQSLLGRIANASEMFQQRSFLNGGGSVISMREQIVASDVCRGTPSCAGGQ